MLYVHGRLINVGIPDMDKPLPQLHAFDLVPNGVTPWVEEPSMKDVAKEIKGVGENTVRYRYLLT